MRIGSSNVDMYSGRTYSVEKYEERAVKETSESVLVPMMKLEAKESLKTTEETTALTETTKKEQEEDALAEEKKETGETAESKTIFVQTGKIVTAQEKKDTQTIRQQCIQYLLEMLLLNRERTLNGQKSHRITYQQWLSEKQSAAAPKAEDSTETLEGTLKATLAGVRAGTKKTTQTSVTCCYSEKERTTYQTKGTVVTADGRQIEFELQFAMSRSFEEYYNENYETSVVSFCDPLVINLDSTMPEVSDQKFLFDLDADGVLDTISMLSGKSGYLAIDKNGDGSINDGSELFGTKSGDGFKDLAEYDDDGNGWIDENDEIWDKLMIWCMDENGKTELYHISEKGIGAICLKNVSSDFSLNSLKTNQTNAAVRNTGIFLYENGNVGTVQHMDLAI